MAITDASVYVADNFAPVTEEHTVTELSVRGAIPEELEGRLLRNGPNPVGPVDLETHHWFLGDGMVHGVRLRGGQAEWYRNRFVGSKTVCAALDRDHDKPISAQSGPNTNVIGHDGRTLAIVEAGTKPVELSYELETIGTNGFGWGDDSGESSLVNGYSAHPKYDPLTGEMHAMCYAWPDAPKLQYVVVDAHGQVTKTVGVSAPTMPMVHDMGLTQKYAIVMDLPVAVDFDLAMAGSSFPVRWFDDYNSRIGLLDRNADSETDIIWCEIDPCFVFHPLNSYDLPDGRVVMDVCQFDRIFDQDRNGPFRDSLPHLVRWTIDPAAGKVHRETLDDRPQEFPRVAGRVLNQPHQFGYVGSLDSPESLAYGPTIKHDVINRTQELHHHGPGREAGEPVFVSRAGGEAEDDGWLLITVFDKNTNRSDVVILDAQDVGGDEVARIELPVRIPHGFHGNWVRDSITPC